MSDEVSTVLTHVATWVAANGSSVGGILLWVTRPLREKLEAFELRLAALEKMLGDPRGSTNPDVLSPAELTRRVENLESWREKESDENRQSLRRDIDEARRLIREIQQEMNHLVSDEEFRGFISVTNQKTDKILQSLGWIRGKLGGVRPADDE